MSEFIVFNPQGTALGSFEADSAEAAIEACVRDAGYDSVSDMEDRLSQPCELQAERVRRYVVEGCVAGHWSAEHAGDDVTFATEVEAQAAIDDLEKVCGWDRTELRVREL